MLFARKHPYSESIKVGASASDTEKIVIKTSLRDVSALWSWLAIYGASVNPHRQTL
jgi:hypothetical protein